MLEILAHTGLVELTVRRSLLTGMQLDRVSAQIAAVDSLYLRALRPRGVVAPSVEGGYGGDGEGISGGLVLDSRPGLYRNILVFDFKSLYPSLIRTFNIDPLTHRAHAAARRRGDRDPERRRVPSRRARHPARAGRAPVGGARGGAARRATPSAPRRSRS